MRILSLIIVLCASFLATGQDNEIRAVLKMNPEQVQTNEVFEIIVETNVNANVNISFPNEFQVINRTKQMQSSGGWNVIVNGKPVNSGKSETIYVFKFITRVSKNGVYELKNASISHANGTTPLNNLTVKVNNAPPVSNSVKNNLNKPFFGIISTSRSQVYVGEPVVVSSKIYSKGRITNVGEYEPLSIEGIAYKTDLFKNINNLEVKNERVENINFQTIKISEDLVIPQEPGEITCTPFSIQLGYQGNFFFTDYTKIVSGNAQIKVLPLPSGAPKSFNGAVGKFDVSTSTSSDTLKEGDVFIYKVKISGKGNLHLLSTPEINLPQAFEKYGDPKKNEKITIGTNGGEGSIEYEFTIQAMESGTHEWKAFSFSYFNPQDKNYHSISIPPVQLHVEKSAFKATEDGSIKRDVQIKGEGSRYISHEATLNEYYFLVSKYYFWVIIFMLPLIAGFTGILLKKRMQNSAEILASGLSKKASKLAVKELQLAKKYWDNNEIKSFAEEGHRALLSFLSRKMKCLPTELNREKIEHAFNQHAIDAELQTKWFGIMQQLEFIRFTSFTAQKENDIPAQMVELITKIDESWQQKSY